MAEFVQAAKTSEVKENEGTLVIVNDQEIALFSSGGKFYAIDNSCPHMGGPLAEGEIEGASVTCPWHAWTFNLATGECETMPGAEVGCYEVKVDGDDILIAMD